MRIIIIAFILIVSFPICGMDTFERGPEYYLQLAKAEEAAAAHYKDRTNEYWHAWTNRLSKLITHKQDSKNDEIAEECYTEYIEYFKLANDANNKATRLKQIARLASESTSK